MITVHQKPSGNTLYMPAFNQQWFIASSNQTAQPNFKYRVAITDLATGVLSTVEYLPAPNGTLRFEASQYARSKVVNQIFPNQTGFKRCNNAIRNIRVNIGEVYGTTPVYTAGSNHDYYIWNAAIDLADYNSYTLDQYTFDSNALTNLLTSIPQSVTEVTYRGRSQYIYGLIPSGQTELQSIVINAYSSNGSLLSSSYISNPFASGSYNDNYVCVDVGPQALDTLSPSYPQPILPANTDYYTVTDVSTNNQLKRYKIRCSAYTVHTLHYLNKLGGYDTLHCELIADSKLTKQQTSFKRSPWEFTSTSVGLNGQLTTEVTLMSSFVDGKRLTTDFMTPEQLEYHKDLATSSDVYLQTDSEFIAVNISIEGYSVSTGHDEKQIVIEVTNKHTNTRQQG